MDLLNSAVSIINHSLPEPQASLLAGMTFGARQTIPKSLYQALIATSTLHIVALSGMNVSIVTNLMYRNLFAFFGKRVSVGLTLGLLCGFVLFVGAEPSILRAAIMSVFAIFAEYFGRRDIPLLSLFLTALIMLLINPALVVTISFQLSVLATLGILLFGSKKNPKPTSATLTQGTKARFEATGKSPFASYTAGFFQYMMLLIIPKAWIVKAMHLVSSIKWFQTKPYRKNQKPTIVTSIYQLIKEGVSDNLRITLAAQTFTIPILLFYFGRISLIGPLANVLIAPFIAPIMYLGFLVVFSGAIWSEAGYLVGIIAYIPLSILIHIVYVFNAVPFSSIQLKP